MKNVSVLLTTIILLSLSGCVGIHDPKIQEEMASNHLTVEDICRDNQDLHFRSNESIVCNDLSIKKAHIQKSSLIKKQAEERKIAEAKTAAERKIAEAKWLEERKIAAEERKIAEAKATEERKIAEARIEKTGVSAEEIATNLRAHLIIGIIFAHIECKHELI